jgi:uncharacterized NAD(P)/FAD-binding protein YdhS
MAAAKKTICIIGAGPAGLVAAKTFLRTGQCNVTIYEKADRLGGIWALDEASIGDYLSPQTPTNLSKFTVGFSDLSWESVRLNGESTDNDDPIFPRAWQVNRYLEAYRAKFIPDGTIQYGHEVTATVRRMQLAVGAKEHWMVSIKDKHGVEQEKQFDHLVVASGFFSTPRPLQQTVCAGLETLPIKAIHSSRFRNLNDLFPESVSPAGKTILIIGGGNSSGEVAAAVAFHLSNAQWAPDPVLQKRFAGCKIIHVTPRPLYGLPPFVPTDESSTSFVPVDFHLYNLARRPPGAITGNAGRVTDGVKDMVHDFMQNMLGGDQSDLGADALVSPKGSERATVQVALSESYPEYVRSGLVEVRAGRVSSITADTNGETSATITLGEANDTIENIGAVVYATGYSPTTALGMLPTAEKEALNYDPTSMRLPLILEQWQTVTKRGSNLALIGFYEGPYWPIMEMQARLTASRWLDNKSPPQKPQEEASNLLSLRKSMQARDLDIPQYWFGDYLGYMEELARELQLRRNDRPFASEREGAVSPARYLSPTDEKTEADKIMADMHRIWTSCRENGTYVPRAVFRALHGNWTLHRRITSSKGALPSGVFSGTAKFLPRFPTPDKSGGKFDLEYLYIETGTFTPTGAAQPITASRRYVYRYSEAKDQMSVWFVKPDANLEVDYLFHDVSFATPAEASEEGACVAKADHLCVEDMYETKYRFPMKGIALRAFQVTHTVKGPSKDYVAMSEFRREVKGQ